MSAEEKILDYLHEQPAMAAPALQIGVGDEIKLTPTELVEALKNLQEKDLVRLFPKEISEQNLSEVVVVIRFKPTPDSSGCLWGLLFLAFVFILFHAFRR